MKLKQIAAALAISLVSVASIADTGGGPLTLTGGTTFFGRTPTATFSDLYSFTLAGNSYLTSGTTSTARVGDMDLDFTSVFITTAAAPMTAVATFAGNLGTDANEFYALSNVLLQAGSYLLHVNGTNTMPGASYAGTLAVVAAVPEPETYALMLAGLSAMGFLSRRRRNV